MSQSKQLSLFDDAESDSNSSETTSAEINPILEENKISLLALAEIQGVGFATIRALFEAYNGNLTQVWDSHDNEIYEYLHKASIPQPAQIIQQIKENSKTFYKAGQERYAALKRHKIEVLFRGEVSYPRSLYDLKKSAPMWLFVEGDKDILCDPAIVAVVGTREPTDIGLDAAKRLSILLVTRGCVILSGLAEGIDEVGHRTAVDYGAPTIAVLGHGIEVVYPASTSDLRLQIVERGGAVVSEYLPRDTYNRERFVQRNRIQAALAKAVAVVEGKAKSGTAHTVRFANELNRHLFGIRLGSSLNSPQQELLRELERQKHHVFVLDNQTERDQLRKYLGIRFPLEERKRAGKAQLFRGLLKEIERLAQDYDAKRSDFDWLIEQVSLYREKAKGLSKYDD